jgi:hypothetical protein
VLNLAQRATVINQELKGKKTWGLAKSRNVKLQEARSTHPSTAAAAAGARDASALRPLGRFLWVD